MLQIVLINVHVKGQWLNNLISPLDGAVNPKIKIKKSRFKKKQDLVANSLWKTQTCKYNVMETKYSEFQDVMIQNHIVQYSNKYLV